MDWVQRKPVLELALWAGCNVDILAQMLFFLALKNLSLIVNQICVIRWSLTVLCTLFKTFFPKQLYFLS